MKNWERHLLRNELASGPLHALFPSAEWIDDGVFLTDSGHLAVIARLNPASWECLEDTTEYSGMDEITASWLRLLPVFGTEMRIYQYMIRHAAPEIPLSTVQYPGPLADRREFLESRRPQMAGIEMWMAFVLEVKRGKAGWDKEIAIDARLLRETVASFLSGIEAHLLGRLCGKAEAYSFLRYLGNLSTASRDVPLRRDDDLAWQLADRSVEVYPVLQVGSEYLRVFTCKEPPATTRAGILVELLAISGNVMVVTEWKPESKSTVRRFVRHKKAKLTHTKEELGSMDFNLSGQKRVQPLDKSDKPVDEAAVDEQRELGMVQIRLRQGLEFGQFSMTVVVHGPDPQALGKAASKAEGCLLLSDGAMVEHCGKPALFAWLSVFPGSKYSIWSSRISDEQYADLSPVVFGPPAGEVWDKHLRGEALTVLESRAGTPLPVVLHPNGSESGNTVLTGAPRSGKSFFAGHVIEQHQEKYGAYSVVFDVTSTGYKTLTDRMGGEYLRVGAYDSPVTINPFCLPETPENIDLLARVLRQMIESDGAGVLTTDETGTIHNQVGDVYGLSEARRRLSSLSLPHRLTDRLAPWRRGGAYAYAFDNPVDTLSFGTDMTTLQFPDRRDSTEVVDALMYYCLARCDREVARRKPQPGLFVFDEGWKFLKRKDSSQFLVSAVKGFPKANVSVLLVTHSISDMVDESVRAVVESCVNQWHCHNPGIDESKWVDYFGLTASEARAIRTGLRLASREYSEVLIKGVGVARLYVDETSRLRLANSATSEGERRAFVAVHGEAALTGRGR